MLTVDTKNERVFWNGVNPFLTRCEFRIIAALAAEHGSYITYRRVYDIMKGVPNFVAGCGEDGYRTNVRSAIKRLRIKFKLVDPSWEEIINYQGFGYAWNTKSLPKPAHCTTCGQVILIYIKPLPVCDQTKLVVIEGSSLNKSNHDGYGKEE